ncbi:MAG: succinate dehydrogenase/fumarate reductase iron-sulfur subunit [Spirochaetia bacterium]|nr:succinate dehydrogenase/fumarate reductase iron-sulfur subunit [Spirochaetia bacterium]
MKMNIKIWRQAFQTTRGNFQTYILENMDDNMSFLEMLDVLNEKILHEGGDPVSFSHDCREGICGSCGVVINGRVHGPLQGVTTCQIYMRHLKHYKTLVIEPWRARAFPIIKDLVTDRQAFDRILQAGGYISINTGGIPDANATPIGRHIADQAFAAASCIGCGACVAACPNASANLFVSAKISHLAFLPQGQPEKNHRVESMLKAMDKEGFGNCSNTAACEFECPKGITLKNIAKLNREYFEALFRSSLEEHPTHPHHGKGDEVAHAAFHDTHEK